MEPNQPKTDTQKEAGIHQDRETPRRDEARTPPEGESQTGGDRKGRQETPASKPRH